MAIKRYYATKDNTITNAFKAKTVIFGRLEPKMKVFKLMY